MKRLAVTLVLACAALALVGPAQAALTVGVADDHPVGTPDSGAAFFALAAQDGAGVDLKALGTRTAAALEGRGGGSGRVFQGKAGSLASRAALADELRAAVA